MLHFPHYLRVPHIYFVLLLSVCCVGSQLLSDVQDEDHAEPLDTWPMHHPHKIVFINTQDKTSFRQTKSVEAATAVTALTRGPVTYSSVCLHVMSVNNEDQLTRSHHIKVASLSAFTASDGKWEKMPLSSFDIVKKQLFSSSLSTTMKCPINYEKLVPDLL